MLTTIQTRLKNQQIKSGKYSLCYLNNKNEWKPIEHIGISVRPFQIVATYGTRPYITVQKFGNRRNDTDTRLFLINMRNGTIADNIKHGASKIIFDKNNESIYFTPLQSNGAPLQTYSWCLPRGNTPYMTINVPSSFKAGVSKIDAKYNLPPIAEITLVEFIPRQTHTPKKPTTSQSNTPKRPRGRPRGSKNKARISTATTTEIPPVPSTVAQPRKRGRPLGSKNKLHIAPTQPTPKRPRGRPRGSQNKPKIPAQKPIPKNTVQLRPTKKNLMGGTIYDVYINGKRVAENRTNATAETFMNNRILVVHSHDPIKISGEYDLFWPDGSIWNTTQRHKYTGNNVHITNIIPTPDTIKLGLSNNSCQTIRESDLQRFALQQFIISNER